MLDGRFFERSVVRNEDDPVTELAELSVGPVRNRQGRAKSSNNCQSEPISPGKSGELMRHPLLTLVRQNDSEILMRGNTNRRCTHLG
jgi:hypothetical protein